MYVYISIKKKMLGKVIFVVVVVLFHPSTLNSLLLSLLSLFEIHLGTSFDFEQITALEFFSCVTQSIALNINNTLIKSCISL